MVAILVFCGSAKTWKWVWTTVPPRSDAEITHLAQRKEKRRFRKTDISNHTHAHTLAHEPSINKRQVKGGKLRRVIIPFGSL